MLPNSVIQNGGQPPAEMTAWKEFVAQEILPEDEDAGY
jgi:hypothetical protein